MASERDLDGFIKNNPLVRPEKSKEWIDLVNKSQNFFKHADRDSEAILEFRPSITPFFILDAVQLYGQIAGEMTLEQRVFWAWFIAMYPDFLLDAPLKNAVTDALASGLAPNNFSPLLALAKGVVPGN